MKLHAAVSKMECSLLLLVQKRTPFVESTLIFKTNTHTKSMNVLLRQIIAEWMTNLSHEKDDHRDRCCWHKQLFRLSETNHGQCFGMVGGGFEVINTMTGGNEKAVELR